MDAGVVSGLNSRRKEDSLAEKTFLLKAVASKRPATASGCGGALATPPHTIFQQPARSRVRLIAVILKNRIHALLDRPSPGHTGRMFWFLWKKLCGSYFFFSSWSRL